MQIRLSDIGWSDEGVVVSYPRLVMLIHNESSYAYMVLIVSYDSHTLYELFSTSQDSASPRRFDSGLTDVGFWYALIACLVEYRP